MSVLGVIPARYGATRFPGKPLADIAGKTLVQRVWERASQAKLLDALVVATDDERIAEHVRSIGGIPAMTSPEHPSGTDRLGEVAAGLRHDYYVNVQGDEPLVEPSAIDALVEATLARQTAMSTLITPITAAMADQVDNPNVVKAIVDGQGYALYFSRSPIPYPRKPEHASYFKHIGIYMYSRETLLALCQAAPVMLEQAESLEQLRAMHNGVRILAVPTTYDPIAVDVPEDVDRVIARLHAKV
jgi:3-deoxy-D-manno-octulosonate cytidylyltransferase